MSFTFPGLSQQAFLNSRIGTLFLLLIWAGALCAHDHQALKFERLSRSGGLSVDTINSILQDRWGFLWLATNRGLERYDGYSFHAYRHEPGDPFTISSGPVTHLVQARGDVLWMVVDGVLNSYDRRENRFRQYPKDSVDGGIQGEPGVLYADRGGSLWLGTSDRGLFLFDSEREGFHHFDGEARASLPSNRVSSVFHGREGSIWVGTAGGGLSRFNGHNNTFTKYLQPDLESYALGLNMGAHHIPAVIGGEPIVADTGGKLWVMTYGGGLIHFNPTNGAYVQYLNDPKNPSSLSHNIVLAIFRDSRDWLWLATAAGGLDLLKPDTGKFIRFRASAPDSRGLAFHSFKGAVFAEDGRGDLWIGNNDGLTLYCPEQEHFFHYHHQSNQPASLSDNQITSLLLDRGDTLWIGTRFGGLNKYAYYRRKFPSYKAAHPALELAEDSLVHAVTEDERGHLWLSSLQTGLIHFDPGKNRVIARYVHEPGQPGPSGRVVTGLQQSGENMWVGTADGGLSRLDLVDRKWHEYKRNPNNERALFNARIGTLYLDGKDRLWVGTGAGGLHRYHPQTDDFSRIFLGSESGTVRALIEDEDNSLWIGRDGSGLYHINMENGQGTSYEHGEDPTSLSHNDVSCLARDAGGRLWVGTLGGGLNKRLDYDRGFQRYTRKSANLPGNVIYALTVDERGYLWLSSDEGLVVLDPKRDNLRHYDSGDGLVRGTPSQAALYRKESGELYFAGRGDIHLFDPESLRHNPFPPSVVLSFLEGGDESPKQIEPGETVTLNHANHRVVLSFAALDFTYPRKNGYAYKMEGLDDDWIYTPSRIANYTHLDPGSYIFRVKAANNDGVWNHEGAHLSLNVLPPFWEVWWFYLLELVLALLVIGALLRFQWGRLQRQKQKALIELELHRKTQELDLARKVQLSMLPERHLTAPGLEIVGRMRTATEVGGDYYDYFLLDEHRICFMLGDATGHGIAAGLAVGMIKMGAAVWAMGEQSSLEEMMRELNLGLKTSLKERTMGMALGVGLIDLRTREVELSFAGMPHPYHYQAATGRLTTLVMKGPPLGFMRRINIQSCRLNLARGDYLVMLSDGLPERFNPENHLWGYRTLERRLQRICEIGYRSEDICRHIFDACDIFADGRGNEDDMTMLVMRALPEAASQDP